MLFDGRWIWVANYVSATVSKIDPRTNDGSHIWLVDDDLARVAVIDVVAGTTTIVPLDVSVGDATFDGTNVWLSLTGSDTVVKLPPQ